MDPAKERRVPHLDRDEQHFVKREEHRDLDDDRQTTGQRVGADLLVHRHDLLLLARLIVGEALADFLHLRLEQFHLAHRRVGFVGEREERQFYKQRQQQDREPKIAEQPIEELQGQKDRFRQEIEPAKIDREIEVRNARFGISIEKVDLLGARKKAGRGGQPSRCLCQIGHSALRSRDRFWLVLFPDETDLSDLAVLLWAARQFWARDPAADAAYKTGVLPARQQILRGDEQDEIAPAGDAENPRALPRR